MKQLITCLLACMGLFACTAPSVTIEGKNEINRQEEFHLYCCQAGSFIPIASAPIDSNGCFHLSVPLPQEGFYLLGTERGVMHPLYLKGNETIRLRFRTKGIVLEGEQTPENQVLSQWERAATLVREHAFLYERFGGIAQIRYLLHGNWKTCFEFVNNLNRRRLPTMPLSTLC